jgi:hypothetical protein
MGWLAKIFGAVPNEQMEGIHLDLEQPFWEVSGETDFPSLLRALVHFLPGGCIVYFEGGSPNKALNSFFAEHAVPEQAHVAFGTIWPRPKVFHVPATPQTLLTLADLSESCAYPELAIHFHVYRNESILLEWHDAFTQPMLLSGKIPKDKLKSFAETLSMKYSKWKNSVEQAAAQRRGKPRA